MSAICLGTALLGILLLATGCASNPAAESAVTIGTRAPVATTTTITPTTLPATTTTIDPVAVHIDELVATMSEAEKTGQLVMGAFRGTAVPEDVRTAVTEGRLGGFFLTSSNGNVASVEQMQGLTGDLQRAASESPTGAGVLLATDQEGRRVGRYNPPGVLIPEDAGTWADRYAGSADPQTVVDLTVEHRVVATDLCTAGLNVNFAPVADVATEGGNVLYRRTYGADPITVTVLMSAVLDAYRGAGVAPTAKHFPGHGATSADSHQTLPTISLDSETWETVHRPPFRAAIAADVPLIMVGHLAYSALDDSGLPSSLSPAIVTGILRDQLGFDGVVITDDLSVMDAVAGFPLDDRVTRAVNAGVDIVLLANPADALAAADALANAVELGTITPERLDAAVRQVLQLKADLGLLAQPAAPSPCGAIE